MQSVILIGHNLRSCHNVGSLLRTAEGLGVAKVYLTGYTPYPAGQADDPRLPHEALKLDKQIHKTALDAENQIDWEHRDDVLGLLQSLRADGYAVMAVEQTTHSISLPDFTPPQKIALLVGREVEGVEPEVLAACDGALEIPMFGHKESFNVAQAAAIALYHCTFKALA
ncbi:MAG TPA: TrmH family RNA methyltransferase [Candidatus Saccharimonadales bacterium]|nr:TrmH family RNA methyltransferase [Candidatus Saccharimonadales bacterium]